MSLRSIFSTALVASALALAGCGVAKDCVPNPKGADLTADVFETYLPWKASAACVQTTESGLQYIVLKQGPEDGVNPTPKNQVSVHYDGRRTNGEKFDSSYERGTPATFGVTEVIAGWIEGLQLMKPGDEFLFYIPNNLAYGDQQKGGVIQPGDDLVFRVSLLEIIEPLTTDREAWDKYLPWSSDAPEVIKTGTGLEYVVLESGPEDARGPEGGELVAMHYEGRFSSNGVTFDSSYQGGQPMIHPANRFIPGWVEMLKLMKPGDRVMVHIPSGLGYGETGTEDGTIPPNADLQFEMQLIAVRYEH